jgi:hypothetical protein
VTPCHALVRVRIPDRPGALGLVASRIGAVKGDIVGVEVLDRDDDTALDELAVILPDPALIPTLEREIAEVDGVGAPSVTVVDTFPEPRVDEVDCAVRLARARDVHSLVAVLVERVDTLTRPDWCQAEAPGLAVGSAAVASEVTETIVLPVSGITVALGRTTPLGRSERALVASYCELVDVLWLGLPSEARPAADA